MDFRAIFTDQIVGEKTYKDSGLNIPVTVDPYANPYTYCVSASGMDAVSLFNDEKNKSTELTMNDENTIGTIFSLNPSHVRLFDIDEELKELEAKHKMDSGEFFKKWQNAKLSDDKDYQRWANLVKRLNYAKNSGET